MLCDSCRRPLRPVVACDIDGTLGDYHLHFMKFAQKWLNVPTLQYRSYHGDEPHRDWFCKTFETDVTTFRQIKLAYRQGGLKRWMPSFIGASYFCESVREAGAELWLTTTRPFERYDRIDPDTRWWLAQHRIEFDGLIYQEDKYEELHERIGGRVVFVLDDLIDQLVAAEDFWPGATVLINRAENSLVEWPTRAADLEVATEMALAHLEDWKIINHFDDLPTTAD